MTVVELCATKNVIQKSLCYGLPGTSGILQLAPGAYRVVEKCSNKHSTKLRRGCDEERSTEGILIG